MGALASEIATAALRLFQTPPPPRRRARIERSAADFVACVQAGLRRPEAAPALRIAGRGEVFHTPLGLALEAPGAALVYGTAGALLQLHDVFAEGGNHPSSVVASAVLAMRPASHASLEAALRAMAAGYEITNRLAQAGYPSQQQAGLTPTAIAGALGAALAAGLMLEFSEEQLARAASLAPLCAPATPFQALRQHGSATPLHGGLAARAGVEAALLAQAGADAGDRSLDGDADTPGWLDAMRIGRDAVTPAAWDGSTVDGVIWKLFPACFACHPTIEAVLRAPRVDPSEIEAVEVGLAPAGLTLVSEGPRPDGGLYDRLMSVRWAVARCLIDGAYGPTTANAENDADLDALVARISVVAAPELAGLPPDQLNGRLRICLRSGEQLDLRHTRTLRDPMEDGAPRGSADDPGDARLDAKLTALAGPAASPGRLRLAFAPN